MKKISETIVFFGSGPVAAKSLVLLAKNFSIEAIITKPKPSHHRGNFPVLDVAQTLGLLVHTVSNKAELSTLMATKPVNSELAVLIDFGIIVNQDVIDFFPLGIVNSHFSILPDLRGADPITFAILSGQEMTGVSLMLLVRAMDEGPLLSYSEQPLDGSETTPSLTDQLIRLSDALLRDQLPRYRESRLSVPQQITGRKVSYSRKLTKADGIINWTKPAAQIEREIRAFAEWPKSHTQLANKNVIITKAYSVPSQTAGGRPGDIEIVKEAGIIMVCTTNGSLVIQKLKPVGKQEIATKAFIDGYGKLS